MAVGDKATTLQGWLAERYPGTYADGKRRDELCYLQCKLILKPDRITTARVFKEFAHLVRRAAEATGVDYHDEPKSGQRPEVREVLFLDTGGFHLYNNGYIVRRRIAYEDGFPIGDPEIVFKFRSPGMKVAQELDVRPSIDGKYKIKFKLEVVPLRDRIDGMRRLVSHNVEFGLSQAPQAERIVMASLGHMSLHELATIFPPLAAIPCEGSDDVSLVNQTIVEELMQDICLLDFGHRTAATANLSLWRSRGDHHSFVGEFAFQLRFDGPDGIGHKPLHACERFFLELQQVCADWLALTTTKTGAVYRLKGNPPQAHE
ncbi:MAG: hypothetical protein AB7F22_26335 [Reyranella sp.]|uniref:hypothetical protein n=1 Tax=Reyranella sp. TaxID=1929291 RepID=UPI003D0C2910